MNNYYYTTDTAGTSWGSSTSCYTGKYMYDGSYWYNYNGYWHNIPIKPEKKEEIVEEIILEI